MIKKKILPLAFFTVMLYASCKKELIMQSMEQNNPPPNEIAAIVNPTTNTISFSGYEWKATNSPNKRKAPGNNYWSNKGVWVDQKGYLHLTLTKDEQTKKWFCTQLTSAKNFGNGKYEFWIEGRVDRLDKNVVFGLFNYSGIDYFDEMDIEFAKWGKAKNKNLHYTVYPEEHTTANIWGSSLEFSLNDAYSVHRIIRTNTGVKFESQYDFPATKTHTQTYTSSQISKKEMPIYMNLWAFQNKVPSNQKEVEIIIQKFVFTPSGE